MSKLTKEALIVFGPIAALIAVALINAAGKDSCDVYEDFALNGDRVLVERCVGQLGLSLYEDRIVARF